MAQQDLHPHNKWYQDTHSGHFLADAQPLVPEAAHVKNRFLLDLNLPEHLRSRGNTWLACARACGELLIPDQVTVSRFCTLSSYERLSTALTAAQACGVQRLCNHYAARLAPQPSPAPSRESNQRQAQLAEYARVLAGQPATLTRQSREGLINVGLTTMDIVLLHHIVGFIVFQAQVVAGLQGLSDLPARWIPGSDIPPEAPAALFTHETQRQWLIPAAEESLLNADEIAQLAHGRNHWLLAPLAAVLIADADSFSGLLTLSKQILSAVRPTDTRRIMLFTARISGNALRVGLHLAATPNNATQQALADNASAAAFLDSLFTTEAERLTARQVSQLTLTPALFRAGDTSPEDVFSLAALSGLCGWVNRLEIGLSQAE